MVDCYDALSNVQLIRQPPGRAIGDPNVSVRRAAVGETSGQHCAHRARPCVSAHETCCIQKSHTYRALPFPCWRRRRGSIKQSTLSNRSRLGCLPRPRIDKWLRYSGSHQHNTCSLGLDGTCIGKTQRLVIRQGISPESIFPLKK